MIYTIYKLCCDDTDKFYVGSTKNRKERVRAHRSDSKVKQSKVYQTIREFGGWDNWRMVDLEEYTCDTKRQAEKREEEWRVHLKHQEFGKPGPSGCVNTNKCYGKETAKEVTELRRIRVRAKHEKKIDAIKLIQKRWRQYLKYGPGPVRWEFTRPIPPLRPYSYAKRTVL